MDTGMRGVEEAETIADLRRQGLPIYFTSGKFKGVSLRAIKRSPKGQGKCVCVRMEKNEGGSGWLLVERVRDVEEESVKGMETPSLPVRLYHTVLDASLID